MKMPKNSLGTRSLTAHVAHTMPFKLLITLNCRSIHHGRNGELISFRKARGSSVFNHLGLRFNVRWEKTSIGKGVKWSELLY